MNGLAADDEGLIADELAAVERVIRSGWWILGNETDVFEHAWAEATGSAHAVGVGNGMDALVIGMMALGIGAGDEVITTSMTAFATVLAIVRAGATPVLADIDPDTAMITAASVERCISAATRAVVLVHLYGQAGPAEELAALCTDKGLVLIEDCAQAHGAQIDGRSVGSLGAFAAWSFYPTKNLGAVGDGGAVTTDDPDLALACRELRNYGQSRRYVHDSYGLNSRLDELQSALLSVRLTRLPQWTERRRAIAHAYAAGIDHADVRVLPLPGDPARHVHHLFVVTTARREELQAHLNGLFVDSLSHYPIPVHQQRPAALIRTDPDGMGATEIHAAQCLSIPCNPALSNDQVAFVIAAINDFPRR